MTPATRPAARSVCEGGGLDSCYARNETDLVCRIGTETLTVPWRPRAPPRRDLFCRSVGADFLGAWQARRRSRRRSRACSPPRSGFPRRPRAPACWTRRAPSPRCRLRARSRMPLTVIRSRIGWPASLPPLAATVREMRDDAVDHAVFRLVVAMRRHGRRLPGPRQVALQLGERLAGIAVEHVEHGERGDQPVVIAAPERRVEEVVARLLEADQGAGLMAVALDVGMTRLPVDGCGAVLASAPDR